MEKKLLLSLFFANKVAMIICLPCLTLYKLIDVDYSVAFRIAIVLEDNGMIEWKGNEEWYDRDAMAWEAR